jgi:hypothetical protein
MNQQEFDESLAQGVIACCFSQHAFPSQDGHSTPAAVLYNLEKMDFARFKPGSPRAGKAKLVCKDCAPLFSKAISRGHFGHLAIFYLDGLTPESFVIYEVMSG